MIILDIAHAVADWFVGHPWIVWLMMSLSLLTVLASLVIVLWVIVRIPPDYFAQCRPPQRLWEKMHPSVRVAAVAGKNLLGLVLLLAGAVLSLPLVPGPGVLTMLLGLALVDLPGKRALERWIVAQPMVFVALNKLRAKYGHVPLEKPE